MALFAFMPSSLPAQTTEPAVVTTPLEESQKVDRRECSLRLSGSPDRRSLVAMHKHDDAQHSSGSSDRRSLVAMHKRRETG